MDKIKVPAPALDKLNVLAPSPIIPLKVKLPVLTLMRVLPVNVTAPLKVLLPLRLANAPLPKAPVPAKPAKFSARLTLPCNASVALLATVVVPAVVPNALLLLTATVPAATKAISEI